MEKIKCELAQSRDFNLLREFNIFDTNQSGYISPTEFLTAFAEYTQL